MREFFRGWRRKIGVVALVMACALAMGWVRSFSDQDRFTIYAPRSFWYFGSNSGRLYGQYRGYAQQDLSRDKMFSFNSWNANDDDNVSWVSASSVRRIDCCGFHLSIVDPSVWILTCMIPYWAIVVSLTLLSAWLLLINPRPSVPKTPEPASTTGGSDA